jgi:hypothetical protein
MTDTNLGGWPDAARPGYPLHPERDNWHWVNGTPRKWEAWDDGGAWIIGDGFLRAADFGHRIYQGPCHTPAEVSAQVEAARREAREACAAVVDCGCDVRAIVLAKFASAGEREAWRCCGQHYDGCLALQAAAIRARGDA